MRRRMRRILLQGSNKLGKFQGRRKRKLRQENEAKKLCRVLLVVSYLKIKGFKTLFLTKECRRGAGKGERRNPNSTFH